MSSAVTIAVSALSAVTAVASLVVYLYVVRRSDFVAAREEALALAETRRQVIRELRDRLKVAEERRGREKAASGRRLRELQAALDRTRAQARKDAYQTQHFHAVALSDLANGLFSDLEQTPPDVDSALARIRKLLGNEGAAPRRRSALET